LLFALIQAWRGFGVGRGYWLGLALVGLVGGGGVGVCVNVFGGGGEDRIKGHIKNKIHLLKFC